MKSDGDVLYFDGQCPLCSKEMARLGELADGELQLIDIHSVDIAEQGLPPEVDKAQLLKVLHLRRGNRWITGIEANVAAWEHTRFGLLWRPLRWPIVRHISSWVYNLWAERRYQALYGDRSP